jgi:hypothetical protein
MKNQNSNPETNLLLYLSKVNKAIDDDYYYEALGLLRYPVIEF